MKGPSPMELAERSRDLAEAELTDLYTRTGIDLSELPPIMTAGQLAPAIGSTEGALAQDRYRNRGIPYIRLGRRIRYARAEVARYLTAQRESTIDRH